MLLIRPLLCLPCCLLVISCGADVPAKDQTTDFLPTEALRASAAHAAINGDVEAAWALGEYYAGRDEGLANAWLRIAIENGGDTLTWQRYAESLSQSSDYCQLLRARFAIERAIALDAQGLETDPDRTDSVLEFSLNQLNQQLTKSTEKSCEASVQFSFR
jgi:hypothetical protein